MKQIVEFNPETSIKSSDLTEQDVILVYKENEPIGYVHYNNQKYTLYTNYVDDFIELEKEYAFPKLSDLIASCPFLIFKVI